MCAIVGIIMFRFSDLFLLIFSDGFKLCEAGFNMFYCCE